MWSVKTNYRIKCYTIIATILLELTANTAVVDGQVVVVAVATSNANGGVATASSSSSSSVGNFGFLGPQPNFFQPNYGGVFNPFGPGSNQYVGQQGRPNKGQLQQQQGRPNKGHQQGNGNRGHQQQLGNGNKGHQQGNGNKGHQKGNGNKGHQQQHGHPNKGHQQGNGNKNGHSNKGQQQQHHNKGQQQQQGNPNRGHNNKGQLPFVQTPPQQPIWPIQVQTPPQQYPSKERPNLEQPIQTPNTYSKPGNQPNDQQNNSQLPTNSNTNNNNNNNNIYQPVPTSAPPIDSSDEGLISQPVSNPLLNQGPIFNPVPVFNPVPTSTTPITPGRPNVVELNPDSSHDTTADNNEKEQNYGHLIDIRISD